ncbi:MAG TPA: TrbG/VirB9 family P-type conjugative transfer protein [Stellaceae bacterium]|nr:TrbG/VirB9 family P-type conjugative transfer protein [Stellaceae bacterium]
MIRWQTTITGGAALLCVALAAPAVALEIPKPGNLDSRIRSVPYDPGNVVDLWTAPGAVMVVEFGEGEQVVNVAASDSAYLKAKPSGNYLFFKPMAVLSPQPVVVLTRTEDGRLRRYDFEFETRRSKLGANADVDYSVVFTYPHQAYLKRLAARRAARARAQKAAAEAALREATAAMQNPYDGVRNYHYVARGDRAIAPAAVWDNGYSTAFTFPGMQRIPSVFRINPDGKEATANYSVHGSTVIAPGTAPEWVLRDGGTVLAVYDLAYNPIGATPGTHTISPSVVRVLREDKHDR